MIWRLVLWACWDKKEVRMAGARDSKEISQEQKGGKENRAKGADIGFNINKGKVSHENTEDSSNN